MAMYSRAPRDVSGAVRTTAPHVGPGVYAAPTRALPAPQGEGFAPFGSLRTRNTIFAENTHEERPSPNAYVPRLSPRQGVSFASQTPRFKGYETDSVPPGVYETRRPIGKTTNASAISINGRPKHTPRIKFTRSDQTASIPRKEEVYGYHVDKSGSLRRTRPKVHDGTQLGPGDYTPQNLSLSTNRTMHGTKWSKQSQRRSLQLDVRAGPSPSEYTAPPAIDGTARQPHPHALAAAPFATSASRPANNDRVIENELRPDPSAYTLPDDIALRTRRPESRDQQFLTTSQRFVDPKPQAPPPGVYDPVVRSLEVLDRSKRVGEAPFLHTASRFEERTPMTHVPPPNQYPSMSSSFDNNHTGPYHMTHAFNSTGARVQPLYNPSAPEGPAPGAHHADIDGTGFRPATVHGSNHHNMVPFGVSSERFADSGDGLPGPESYVPPSDLGHRMSRGFGRGKRTDLPLSNSAANPAPNTYTATNTGRRTTGGVIPTTRRAPMASPSLAPAPGTYSITAGPIGDPMNKKSYNVHFQPRPTQSRTSTRASSRNMRQNVSKSNAVLQGSRAVSR
ncbi:uncharacterized protein MONBRDRAFT_37268 [Monosiga brevicollis MX1]|uniref:Uncharacterized protein n=1 Tax=Monosiga brevicollis TaxID=81824 RepID=A9V0P7_MONBE|nr:uncharacterized protein MONBRDRAFT_37268 [Monosiga brevicollis MX1]EDQ88674.1 predicted protein [Monosiga brevicollis MX1]|eukprot:XP_001746287.1 hypothetical protein [Monosiga brevicollis MX1]